MIETYTEAIQTVDCKQANGKFHMLWVEFAKFYEKSEQVKEAKFVFERATSSSYKSVDELANVWCEWAEMELRHE